MNNRLLTYTSIWLFCILISSISADISYEQFGIDLLDALKMENVNKNIWILRNQIFAKHGRAFNTEVLQKYFQNQAWYKINKNYSDSLLSKKELKAVNELSKLEKFLKGKRDSQLDFSLIESIDVEIMKTPGSERKVVNIHTIKTSKGFRLIFSQITQSTADAFEGISSSMDIDVFTLNDTSIQHHLHNTSSTHDELKVDGDFLITTDGGCCGESDDSYVYNLHNGELLGNFNSNYVLLTDNNSTWSSLVVYNELYKSQYFNDFRGKRNVEGFLYLITPKGLQEEFIITRKIDSINYLPWFELSLNNEAVKQGKGSNYKVDYSSVNNVKLSNSYAKIVVPIVNGKIVIDNILSETHILKPYNNGM